MEAANKSEPDTTVTATFAGDIKDFNPEIEGGLMLLERKDSTTTIPKSEVGKFNQSAQQSIEDQEAKAAKIKHEDIDINNGRGFKN